MNIHQVDKKDPDDHTNTEYPDIQIQFASKSTRISFKNIETILIVPTISCSLLFELISLIRLAANISAS